MSLPQIINPVLMTSDQNYVYEIPDTEYGKQPREDPGTTLKPKTYIISTCMCDNNCMQRPKKKKLLIRSQKKKFSKSRERETHPGIRDIYNTKQTG